MGMGKEFARQESFEMLIEVVESLKNTVLDLSARVAAQDAVICALLKTSSDSHRQELVASIRDEADQRLATYDDDPNGQRFRADIGKNAAAFLKRLG